MQNSILLKIWENSKRVNSNVPPPLAHQTFLKLFFYLFPLLSFDYRSNSKDFTESWCCVWRSTKKNYYYGIWLRSADIFAAIVDEWPELAVYMLFINWCQLFYNIIEINFFTAPFFTSSFSLFWWCQAHKSMEVKVPHSSLDFFFF